MSGKKKGPKWRKQEVSDDFLLGLTEPGFQEIEILSGDEVQLIQCGTDSEAKRSSAAANDGLCEDAAKKPQGKKRKRGKKAGTVSTARREGDASTKEDNKILELRSRIAQLESENAELRTAGEVEQKAAGDADGVQDEGKAVDMSAWDGYGLHDMVISSIAHLKYTAPTAIQHECLPAAVQGNADIIGAAQTGSGKTLAFALPIINYLVMEAHQRLQRPGDPESSSGSGTKALRALILCPTRELAMQVSNEITSITKRLGIRAAAIVGGMSQEKQMRLLSYSPPIIVATPGRLWDLIKSGTAYLSDLRHLSFLVLDEADRMVANGHFEELSHILAHIPRRKDLKQLRSQMGVKDEARPIEVSDGAARVTQGVEGDKVETSQAVLFGTLRTYVFSATLTLPEQLKSKLQFAGGSRGTRPGATLEALLQSIHFRGKPKVADLTNERKVAESVQETYISCSLDDRDSMLYYLLCMHPGRTLVFLNAISGVRRVAAILKVLGVKSQVLHAQQQQRQRLKALERFKADSKSVLIATDVAARGLHIPQVDMVVQYQLPSTADTYIHRAGRTGRSGQSGTNVAFVVPQESARFSKLHTVLDFKPKEFQLDNAVIGDIRDRMRLAQRIDAHQRVERKDNADNKWMKRQSELIGFDIDGEESVEQTRGAKKRKNLSKLQQELSSMLSQPLRQRMNSKFFTGGSSQVVAAALDHQHGTSCAIVSSKAMLSSVDEAVRLVSTKKTVPELAKPAKGADASKTRKRKSCTKTLAEYHAEALRKALHNKAMKKSKMQKQG